jgi:hypothetical protein
MQKIKLKRGDTLLLACVLQDGTGAGVDLTNWLVESQVKDGDTLLASLTYTATSLTSGQFNLLCQNTSTWPIRNLVCDIKYTTPDGVVASCDTFEIQMVKNVTDAAQTP